MTIMEQLIHYTWKYRLFNSERLLTTNGKQVEVLDSGLHNHHAGPDFFNAKVRIDGVLWVGNVEIHERASDWYRHHHEADPAYDSVILHVVAQNDGAAETKSGRRLPQVVVEVPQRVKDNYEVLLHEAHYPPCYRIIPHLPPLTRHAWLSALTVERLEQKTDRIIDYYKRTEGNWEWTFFVALARNFGFGVNADAFEAWALRIRPSEIGRHRDHLDQVEAYFFGQAGFLNAEGLEKGQRDEYFRRMAREYHFLQNKFGLEPMSGKEWRFLRMRPQNFPHIRLSQLAWLYHEWKVSFSRIINTAGSDELRSLLRAKVTPYWQTHYTFGKESAPAEKTLQRASLDLLLINTVAPLLFAYGRERMNEELCERAFALLEEVKAEQNSITRAWKEAGISAAHAADSQALLQLKSTYCDKKDCLRCRFGAEYLRAEITAPSSE